MIPIGFNSSNFITPEGVLDPNAMYIEVFRLIENYPKIAFYLILASFLMSVFVLYFKREGNWVDKWSVGFNVVTVQFLGFALAMMIPITFDVTLEGFVTFGSIVKWLLYLAGFVGVLIAAWKVWKNRGKIKGLKIDDVGGEGDG